MSMAQGPCQAAREHANARKKNPRLRACDCLLEVLREAPAAVEPSKRSFNHPAFSLRLEGADTLQSRDDLNGPFAELIECIGQLLSAVHAVSKDVTQLWEDAADIFQQRYRAVDVLDVGRSHLKGKQRAHCIGDDVTLASLHFLAGIKPARTATFCGFHRLA